MGLRLKIEGNESISLKETSIMTVEFTSDIPHDCYRNVLIEVVNASQIVRQITLPNAFVIDYKEDFSDEAGTGVFTLLIKQKKDKMATLKFEGGFGGE